MLGAVARAPPAAAAPVADSDSVYLDFLQSHGVSIDQPGQLTSTAGEICQAFDDGLSFIQVGNVLMQTGQARTRRRSRSSGPLTRTARHTTRNSTSRRRRRDSSDLTDSAR
jgi:hypothetical protein